jgi:HlyD family secretion protein
VQEGQVLARLDPATYRARLEQARADLAVADATVRMQEAAIERARSQIEAGENAASDAARSLSRTEQLSRTGATSEKQLQADRFAVAQARIALNSSRAQLRIAQAEVAVAQGQVQQRRAAVAIAETDLERTIIRSPVRGVVVNRNIDNGQTVAASLQAPLLFEIAQDLADMRLEASVDEADVGRVREGQRAFFGVDAHPGRVFHGRVVQVRKAPKLIQNVTTYAVVIDVENPDLALFPGMTANVRIVQSLREDAVKVPLAALRFSPLASPAAYSAEVRSTREERGASTAASGGAGQATRQRGAGGVPTSEGSVYTTDEDGSARRIAVVVGLVGDSDAEIVSGLTAGEAIIVGHADRPPPHAARPAAAL